MKYLLLSCCLIVALMGVLSAQAQVTDIVDTSYTNLLVLASGSGVTYVPNATNVSVISVGKTPDCNATEATIFDNTWALVGTAPFIGNTAVLTVPLTTGSSYHITGRDPSHGDVSISFQGETYPIVRTNGEFIDGFYCDPTTTCSGSTVNYRPLAYCIINVTTGASTDDDFLRVLFDTIPLHEGQTETANLSYVNPDGLVNVSWIVGNVTVYHAWDLNITDSGMLFPLDSMFYSQGDIVTFFATGDDENINISLLVHAGTNQTTNSTGLSILGTTVDADSILFFVWLLLLVLSIVLLRKIPLFSVLFGMYSVIFAFIIAAAYGGATGFLLWLIIAAVGGIIGAVGFYSR